MSVVDFSTARAAKEHLAATLSANPLVNGVGIHPVRGGYALKVNLLEQAPQLEVPSEIDGVDVHVEVSGLGFPQRL